MSATITTSISNLANYPNRLVRFGYARGYSATEIRLILYLSDHPVRHTIQQLCEATALSRTAVEKTLRCLELRSMVAARRDRKPILFSCTRRGAEFALQTIHHAITS